MPDATTASAVAPTPQLDEVMLAMDVVDTLRHQDKLVERELGQDTRDEALRARLRQIYQSQGLEVDDRILNQGIKDLKESRFVYTPTPPSFNTFLARMWVARSTVGPVLGVLVLLLVAFVGWRFWHAGETARVAEQTRIELTETLPAAVNQAGEAAMVAAANAEARAAVESLISEGKVAAAAADGDAMHSAITDLNALRASLLQAYTLTIVSREGEDTGVYRIPDVNEATRNYYIVVEALTESGGALSLPIRNEENGQVDTVSKWAVRVPESTFEAIRADKSDDGIVQNNILGEKRRGALNVAYLMPVADGAITTW